MMKTKDRILATSLTLFNERGLSQVTLRTIAKEMGISQGNLNYHFKKRQDIIEGLYFQLVGRMDEIFQDLVTKEVDILLIFESNRGVLAAFYNFRFFMLDFVQIMRENPSIKEHYLQLQQARIAQFQQTVTILQDKKLVRLEEFKDEFYHLYQRMSILGDFWLSAATISGLATEHDIQRYQLILSESIYPYLTPAGKRSFLQHRKKLKVRNN